MIIFKPKFTHIEVLRDKKNCYFAQNLRINSLLWEPIFQRLSNYINFLK